MVIKGPKIIVEPPGPKAREIIEKHRRYVATTTHDPENLPLVVEKGDGVWLYDVFGPLITIRGTYKCSNTMLTYFI